MHGTMTQRINNGMVKIRTVNLDDLRTWLIMLASDYEEIAIEIARTRGKDACKISGRYRACRTISALLMQIAVDADIPFTASRWNDATYRMLKLMHDAVEDTTPVQSTNPNDADGTPQ